ncbi:unnamed protein product [Caenorhabditis bovis]|uniref:Uncharacterized protein n=1 Tax=Caenorhabditis bovis TaxID=2654633 RepID=A0A8S1E7F7_9PELO|nr:unnamed protein product [Caenorhabditis bovis]
MVCCDCPITNVLIIGGIAYFIYKMFIQSTPRISSKPEVRKKDYKKDTVYLYQFPRVKNCPNLSPFCLKIEILCRAFGIDYEVINVVRQRSRNGTLPFIELNGEHIADSDLIEVRLREHFKIPSLPPAEEAHAVAISRMADNHLFYLGIVFKIQCDEFHKMIINMVEMPSFVKSAVGPLVKRRFSSKVYARAKAAIGDFEPHEREMLLKRDLKAIEDSIKGKFLFGDKIAPVDATVFGQLASVYYLFPTRFSEILDGEFPKIVEYMDRVKNEIYPNDFISE